MSNGSAVSQFASGGLLSALTPAKPVSSDSRQAGGNATFENTLQDMRQEVASRKAALDRAAVAQKRLTTDQAANQQRNSRSGTETAAARAPAEMTTREGTAEATTDTPSSAESTDTPNGAPGLQGGSQLSAERDIDSTVTAPGLAQLLPENGVSDLEPSDGSEEESIIALELTEQTLNNEAETDGDSDADTSGDLLTGAQAAVQMAEETDGMPVTNSPAAGNITQGNPAAMTDNERQLAGTPGGDTALDADSDDMQSLSQTLLSPKNAGPTADIQLDQESPPVPVESVKAATTALVDGARTAESLPVTGRSFTVQPAVGVPVEHSRWSEAVVNRVMWLSAQNIPMAELRLDPPELGPLQVRIQVQNDQVQVSFVSQSASVRDALDQNANRLREMFGEAGLMLDLGVSDQSFSRHQQQSQDGTGTGGSAEGDDPENTPPESGQVIRLVDHYA